MTLQEVQVLFQSISALAIAGGFVFTAYQFRHLRKSQQVANFTKLVELQMHLRELRVKDPDLAHVFRDDVRELSTDREVREYFFSLMQLSVYEIVWFSHKQGMLPEGYFASWAKRMKVIATEPAFRKMINSSSMKIMHDDFQQYVMELVRHTNAQGKAGADATRPQ